MTSPYDPIEPRNFGANQRSRPKGGWRAPHRHALSTRNARNLLIKNRGAPAKVSAQNQLYKKYRYLIENLAVAVGISDIDGNVVEANKNMCRLTGYPREELLKTNLAATYVDPQDRLRLIKLVKENGEVNNFEARLKNKRGKPYWASLSIKKIKLNGKDYVLTCKTDVTAIKRLEDEHKKNTKELEEFHEAVVGRELKMKELEEEINRLKGMLGKKK